MKHHPILRLGTIAFILSFLISTASFAAIYYVMPGGNDNNYGNDWQYPFRTIQKAIDIAQPGDEIWVASGTYLESITLREGVQLYGGFTGGETSRDQRDWTTNLTRIYGYYGYSDPYSYLTYSVVRFAAGTTSATVLDGFQITGARTNYGGGIYCKSASPTIRNNTIFNNYADYGGGIYCYGESSQPVIDNNYITLNDAVQGGGIFCESGASPTISNNNISANTADEQGAGIKCGTGSWNVINNFIARNKVSAGSGGGVYLDSTTTNAVFQNNQITGNSVMKGNGGGVYAIACYTTLMRNVITGNSAAGYFDQSNTYWAGQGGGIYCAGGAPNIVSSNVSANGASLGGGVMIAESSTAKIVNSTITANSASDGGGICSTNSSSAIINTIVVFNSSGVRKDISSTLTLRNNCIYGNTNYNYSGVGDQTGVSGNISADPKLADWGYGNIHIQPNSPCINYGDDTVVPSGGWTDIDGQQRKQGARVDIGADESDGTTWPITHAIIRVSPTGDDSNDGSTWTKAKETIQAGIDAASEQGGEVWVSGGSYSEGLTLFPYTYVYGGFRGTETDRTERDWRANIVRLSGRSASTVTVPAGYQVSAVDGFTIRDGRGTLFNQMRYGGGIYCYYSSPSIANNTFTANSADYGGAIYCDYSAAQIENNRIVDNDATSGAGIYCDNRSLPFISGNTFTGNDAVENGGAIASGKWSAPKIHGNNLVGNIARRFGGAIYTESGSTPRICNNIISANTAATDGAGIYHKDSFPTILNNVFTGNAAAGRGGAMFYVGCSAATAANNTLTANKAGNDGGAIFIDTGSSPTVVNNIMAFNSSGVCKNGTGVGTFKSNCVYGNTDYQFKGMTDPTGTNGNISEDPKLAAISYKDTHIQPGSPCIDKGDGSVVQPEWLDMDGENRVQGAAVDIGADESDGTTWDAVARIVRVSSTGSDSYDGSSWAFAKRTVQSAIDVVSADGGEIWVKAGTYRERIMLRPYANLYGGFAGTETKRDERSWSANVTVLDGNTAGTVVTVPMADIWSTIDGFTIRGGKAEDGGGIYCYYASPTIANNIITGSSASKGSGIFCHYASPMIVDNDIIANTGGSGGGVFCFYSNPTIKRNVINGNQGGSGGGVICYYSTPLVANNMISGNSADAGGGVFCNNESSATVINNIIWNNIGRDNGGGVYCDNGSNALVYNNTIVGNSSDNGGSVYANGCSPVLVNNIIAYGSSGIAKAGGGTVTLKTNCFYGNAGGDFSGLANAVGTNGNIGLDPQLVSFTNGDMHLKPESPCIDKGTESVVKGDWVDWDLKSRKYGSQVDIGADEWSPDASTPANESLTPNSGGLPVGDAVKSMLVAKYTDPDGYANLANCYLLLNTSLTGVNGVYAYYDSNDRKLYLRNDANTAWIGGYAPGTSNVIQNTQCKLYCAGTTVTESGSSITVNWKIEFKVTMSGKTCSAWMMVEDDDTKRDGWDKMGTFAISRPPVNVSVGSNGGIINVGSKSTLIARYSDADGAANLTGVYLLVNTAFTGAKALYVCYSEDLNKLYLRDDSNANWLGGYAPGSANVIQNSYAKVYCADTTAVKSGNELTLNLIVEFKSPFAQKSVSTWMLATDAAELRAGWDQKGQFTVGQTFGTQAPENTSFAPSSGSINTGIKNTFTSVYTDEDGYADVADCYALINTQFSGANAVYLWYDANNRRVYLRNDTGTSWGTGGTLGSATVLENASCKVYCFDTKVTESGNAMTVKWAVELKRVMTGKTCQIWQKVYDDADLYGGWDQMGAFDIIGQPPSIGTLSPASGELPTVSQLMFTSKYSDPDGYTNLADCYLLINSKFTGVNGVYVWYDANQNKLYVRNDANTVWTGGYTPGSSNVIENSYFKLYCAGTTVSTSGTQLTINWKIELKSTFSGKTCGAWMATYDDDRLKDGWRQVGSFTTD